MVILISGASHSGKTMLSQRLMEEFQYPYLSIDHLKMGLIRAHYTDLTVEDDQELTEYLWPILVGMIQTIIENNQNIIIEGVYIPFNYQDSFTKEEREQIQYLALILSKDYILNNFNTILAKRSVIETRLDFSEVSLERLIEENKRFYQNCIKYHLNYYLIEDHYRINLKDLSLF